MDKRRGGQRNCPRCKIIVETRVRREGYSQPEFHGIPAKKRQILCGTDAEGPTDAEPNGSPWKYSRIRFYGRLGRKDEKRKEKIPGRHNSDRKENSGHRGSTVAGFSGCGRRRVGASL
jgi:hypothetical protein